MPTRETHWEYGTPSWVSLLTPDRSGARAFYGALLDWQFRVARGDRRGYVIALLHGRPVAGIEPAGGAADRNAVWITHLAADDVVKRCRCVQRARGRVVRRPRRVGREARDALLADPTGAVFGLWEGRETIGAEVVNEPGALVWNECHTTDAPLARGFYHEILDYRYAPLEGPSDYTMIARRGEWGTQPRVSGYGPGAGMGGIAALEPGVSAPRSCWQAYFGVHDVGVAVREVRLAGGAVLRGPFRGPHGPVAQCRDPQGARFWLAQVHPPS